MPSPPRGGGWWVGAAVVLLVCAVATVVWAGEGKWSELAVAFACLLAGWLVGWLARLAGWLGWLGWLGPDDGPSLFCC